MPSFGVGWNPWHLIIVEYVWEYDYFHVCSSISFEGECVLFRTVRRKAKKKRAGIVEYSLSVTFVPFGFAFFYPSCK
jgi:hypothetical protein